MNVGNIAGGTHAGWRRVKQKPLQWLCDCFDSREGGRTGINPGYRLVCQTCKNPRPN